MKKTLIILAYDFPPKNGGIARLCSEIAQGMNQYYEYVEVITRNSSDPNASFKPKSFKVKRFSQNRIKLELAIVEYLKSFSKKDTDILCGLWHPEAMLALLAGHKNVFVLGHGTEFLHAENWFRKYIWLGVYAKFVLGKSKRIITNSNYTKGLVQKICPNTKIEALPLAVNERLFSPTNIQKVENHLSIASLSRIYEFKGYDTIAKAIANLDEAYRSKIIWNIGGTGPYLSYLKEMVRNLGINDNVNFLGFIKDEHLAEFYSSNDLFILCTKESEETTEVEGFGLVFLEAQSCGVPAIGTNTGGIPDAIKQEQGGWLISQNDDKALTSLLIHFIKNPSILEQQSIIARNRVLEQCTFRKYRFVLNQLMNDVEIV